MKSHTCIIVNYKAELDFFQEEYEKGVCDLDFVRIPSLFAGFFAFFLISNGTIERKLTTLIVKIEFQVHHYLSLNPTTIKEKMKINVAHNC